MLFAIVVYFTTASVQRTAQEEARQPRIMKRHAKLKLTKSQKSKAIWPNKEGEYAIYVDPTCHKDTKTATVLAQRQWKSDGHMPIEIIHDKNKAN